MLPSKLGASVVEEWMKSDEIRREIKLDEFVLMPNHFHAIVWITSPAGDVETAGTGRVPLAPTASATDSCANGARPRSLASLIIGFKSATSRIAGRSIWQRNYFDRVMRYEDELLATRIYIRENPRHWAEDEYHQIATPGLP